MGPAHHRRLQRPDPHVIGTSARTPAPPSSSTAATLSSTGTRTGSLSGPTLIDNVSAEMDVYREEIFGPVLAVVRVDTLDEAHRPDQSQQLRATAPPSSPVQRRCRAAVSARRPRRHDRCQRADSGADGVLQLRRLEGLAYGDLYIHGPRACRSHTAGRSLRRRWPEVDVLLTTRPIWHSFLTAVQRGVGSVGHIKSAVWPGPALGTRCSGNIGRLEWARTWGMSKCQEPTGFV